jgi:hypothetical protein
MHIIIVVLDRIERYGKKNGHCYIRYSTLAEELGLSVWAIRRAIAILRLAGASAPYVRQRHRVEFADFKTIPTRAQIAACLAAEHGAERPMPKAEHGAERPMAWGGAPYAPNMDRARVGFEYEEDVLESTVAVADRAQPLEGGAARFTSAKGAESCVSGAAPPKKPVAKVVEMAAAARMAACGASGGAILGEGAMTPPMDALKRAETVFSPPPQNSAPEAAAISPDDSRLPEVAATIAAVERENRLKSAPAFIARKILAVCDQAGLAWDRARQLIQSHDNAGRFTGVGSASYLLTFIRNAARESQEA